MNRSRWLLAMLLCFAWLVGVGATPASACSCFGMDTIIEAAGQDETDVADVVFYGKVVDSGNSDVTASAGSTGLALLFEVREVLAGEVGPTVVVHTPGGRVGSGDCSVGVLTGDQLVMAQSRPGGNLTAGMCSIFPGVTGEASTGVETIFEAGRPPNPDLPRTTLGASTPVLQDELPMTQIRLFSGVFLAGAIAITVYGSRRLRRRKHAA